MAADASEAMHLVLRCGAARFLRLEELLVVISACTLLRCDAALVRRSAAETIDADWFPAVLTDISAHASGSRRLHELWETGGTSTAPLLSVHGASVQSELQARVLALAVFLKKRIMRWCFVYEALDPDAQDGVLCSVRPALIPIKGFVPDSTGSSGDRDDVSVRERIRAQLNAMTSGFGDSFTGLCGSSRFGSHWDNICIDARTGSVQCKLCLAAAHSIAFYRRQAALFIARYNEKLAQQHQKWSSEGGESAREVDALTEAFRSAHFPLGAYIAFDAMRWTEAEVLQHLCRYRRIQLEGAFGSVRRSSVPDDDLSAILSSKYRRQCRRFYLPLKTQLLQRLKFVGRAQLLATSAGDWSSLVNSQPRIVEFVGGVDTATGILCGVYCSYR